MAGTANDAGWKMGSEPAATPAPPKLATAVTAAAVVDVTGTGAIAAAAGAGPAVATGRAASAVPEAMRKDTLNRVGRRAESNVFFQQLRGLQSDDTYR
jgi:hypothetical protein